MADGRAAGRGPESGQRLRLAALIDGPLARILSALAIVLVPLVLGYFGLRQYLAEPAVAKIWGQGWKNTLFYDLQLPILGSGPVEGAGPFPAALGIARFLAPAAGAAATLGALFLLLTEQRRRLRAATAARHAVVAGDGPVAVTVARYLRAERRTVVLVSTSDDTLTEARRHKVLGVRGDLADSGTLRAASVARASELFACTDAGTLNAAIVLRARDEIPARMERRQPLAAYAMVRDAELGVALRARRIGVSGDPRLRLDFFSVEDIAARGLFDKYPLVQQEPHQTQVVISGFGQLGQAVLREAARRRQALPGTLPVAVFVRHASKTDVENVADAFPAIKASCQLTYGETPPLPAAGEYTAYVCLDDDDGALSEGLAMAHALASAQGHVVVCMREEDPFAEVLAARSGLIDDVMGRLSVFGVIQEGCVPANIRADFTDQIARSIHAAYVSEQQDTGATEATNPSMAPWERLSLDLRRANIDQAVDIGAKMTAIGAIVIPESAAAPEFHFADDQEVERLAIMEHDRWMRERTAAGWKYGAERDNDKKLHPDLKPWADLNEADRDKDRNAIRTLPETLHKAGFQILRLPSP
jgi:RyR domain/TrkA-N domain